MYSTPFTFNEVCETEIPAAEETQHLPIPRATTAACDVIPPRSVKIPSAAYIPFKSSGEVSRRTRITFSPAAASTSASCAVNTILPVAAPGDAGSPFERTLAFAIAAVSNTGCNNSSNLFGS